MSKYIIRINNPLRIKWDMIVILLSIWNSIATPIEIAFKPPRFEERDMDIMNHIIDIMFVGDILLNFVTSYFNSSTGDEIFEPKNIAKHYLQGVFWIDFLSVCPFNLLLKDVIKD